MGVEVEKSPTQLPRHERQEGARPLQLKLEFKVSVSNSNFLYIFAVSPHPEEAGPPLSFTESALQASGLYFNEMPLGLNSVPLAPKSRQPVPHTATL